MWGRCPQTGFERVLSPDLPAAARSAPPIVLTSSIQYERPVASGELMSATPIDPLRPEEDAVTDSLDLYKHVLPPEGLDDVAGDQHVAGGWRPSPVLVRNLGVPDFSECQPTESLEALRPAPLPPAGSQDLLQLGPLEEEEPTQSIDTVAQPPAPRRGFERFDFSTQVVRAQIWNGPKGPPKAGRVQNGSVSGMWIQTKHPLPFKSYLQMEWQVGGRAMSFSGRVVRSIDDGMAVHLDTDDSDWRFRSAFVDAIRGGQEEAPIVVIRPSTEDEHVRHEENRKAVAHLAALWEEVEGHLDEEEAHQSFIHECLRLKRTEFALERYRELKRANPNAERVDRYLQQIGTILSFYTFTSHGTALPEKKSKSKIYVVIFLVFAAVLAIVAGAHILSRRSRRARVPAAEWGHEANGALRAPTMPEADDGAAPGPSIETQRAR